LKQTIIFILGIISFGCASTPHTAKIGWEEDKIRLEFFPPDISSPELQCLSCNQTLTPLPLQVNDHGIAYIRINEARTAITSHFHLKGSGIDTLLTLQQPPDQTTKDKLIGRLLITRYALIYKDTTMTETVGSLERNDEVNLFGEGEVFYYIHHPLYPPPVVVLKSHAVKIE
jgi:hypothetical protein